jgi:hypothetical protein
MAPVSIGVLRLRLEAESVSGSGPRNAHMSSHGHRINATNCPVAIHTLQASHRYRDNERAVSITIYQKAYGDVQQCYLDIGLQPDTMHRAESSFPQNVQLRRLGRSGADSRSAAFMVLFGEPAPVAVAMDSLPRDLSFEESFPTNSYFGNWRSGGRGRGYLHTRFIHASGFGTCRRQATRRDGV